MLPGGSKKVVEPRGSKQGEGKKPMKYEGELREKREK
jgi:hypothetical protein